jgi:hypothetical protein
MMAFLIHDGANRSTVQRPYLWPRKKGIKQSFVFSWQLVPTRAGSGRTFTVGDGSVSFARLHFLLTVSRCAARDAYVDIATDCCRQSRRESPQ